MLSDGIITVKETDKVPPTQGERQVINKCRDGCSSGGCVSDLRTEAGGGRMALDGFACKGLAEGLTSELTLSEERRPAVGSSGGGVFRAEGTAGWRALEGQRESQVARKTVKSQVKEEALEGRWDSF